ncbi:MAG: AEC family transporter [Anaerolineae bacterium]
MNQFAHILVNNILPAFLVMGAGWFLDRKSHIEIKSISRLAIYVLTPCLIFSSVSQSSVNPAEFGLMIAFALVTTVVMCLVAMGVGWALRWQQRQVDALVLSVGFVNAGNFGLSIILFSFGEVGLELGTVFFVASNFTCNTLAAFFAARSNGGGRKALGQVLRLPGLYAFLLALGVRLLELPMPDLILKPTSLIGGGSVPIMLMLLGIQLSRTRVVGRGRDVAVAVVLRLVGGAALAIGLAPVMGLTGLAGAVAITEAATPTAVSSALMAIEFDADAEYVTSAIFYSTLVSGVTLAVLLAFLT